MNGLRKNFRLPQGGAEHHQIYASINVRKILDTTVAANARWHSVQKFPSILNSNAEIEPA